MPDTPPTTLQRRINHVEMRGITKRFPGVLANAGVNLDIYAGEVHSLLGENGAGKSTLMRQLYGMYQPDEGQILIDGVPHVFNSPSDAIKAGIGMIHQHFMLVPTLTVAENVALGLKSSRGLQLDLDKVAERVTELSKAYGLKVFPGDYVWQLSVGEQQRVEIIKALYRGASVIVLDEPTAVLTPQEVCDLFVTLKRMVSEGHALVFISHKMHEVMEISTRVSVLRDGYLIGSRPAAGATRDELVAMMVGRDVKPLSPQPLNTGAALLKVTGLHAIGDRGTEALAGVDLELRGGEILGLAGVSGNGQRELCQCLAGLRPVTAGTIIIDGKDMTHASLHDRMEAGQAYIPEERMRDGAIREFSVEENIFLHEHNSPKYTARRLSGFRQDGGPRAGIGHPVRRQDTGAQDADQESVGRQYPESDHGARALAQPQDPACGPADARRRHRRQRVHSPAPPGTARGRHGDPVDLGRPGRNPGAVRSDRRDL